MKKPSRSRLYAIHRGFFEGFNQFELLNVEELEEIHLRFLKLNFTEPPNGSTGQNRSLAEVVTKKKRGRSLRDSNSDIDGPVL